jgi:hypothetical protein
MKNHVLKVHADVSGEVEDCYLLKVEGAYAKGYWLFVDVALDKSLSALDSFLRKIWLECCGHMSAFRVGGGELGKNRRVNVLSVGDVVLHEYDFGTTTETLITVIGESRRLKQREAVRLLARNASPVFTCVNCGKPAEYICTECKYEIENPFYCESCCEEHTETHDSTLPITNSPRMGECGYDGEEDLWDFIPHKDKE